MNSIQWFNIYTFDTWNKCKYIPRTTMITKKKHWRLFIKLKCARISNTIEAVCRTLWLIIWMSSQKSLYIALHKMCSSERINVCVCFVFFFRSRCYGMPRYASLLVCYWRVFCLTFFLLFIISREFSSIKTVRVHDQYINTTSNTIDS